MIQQGRFLFMDPPPEGPSPFSLIQSDVIDALRSLPDSCLDLVISSPPYFQQIDYGVEGQHGLEGLIHQYLTTQVEVGSELLRICRPHANVFWVIRDSIAGSGGTGGDYQEDSSYKIHVYRPRNLDCCPLRSAYCVPERIMLAWQSIGWLPRPPIIWDKQNALRGGPRSPSYSYEKILWFVRSPDYQWFRGAVLEKRSEKSSDQLRVPYTGQSRGDYQEIGREDPSDLKRRAIKSMMSRPGVYLKSILRVPPGSQPRIDVGGRQVRGVASFPVLLAEILVNVASSRDQVVLDPYCGLGTVGVACRLWGRKFIGIDLNPDFVEASRERILHTRAKR